MRAVLILSIGLLLAGCADPPEPQSGGRARYVEGGAKKPQAGDLAGVLRIEQMRGRAELRAGYRNATLVLTAYKDGKPVELPDNEDRVAGGHDSAGTVKFAVDIVDLDFFPLGGGKKGHCRLRASFEWPDGSFSAVERDVPKQVIDLSDSSKMAFTEAASAGREVPLLWFVKGGPVPVTAKTKEQVLERVKAGQLLFVTLRFDDPEKGKGKE
jgi:hypothetical protein